MEDALKASIAGLKRVDHARKLKGWNRQSSGWAQSALTTVSTLKQFWRRERVQRDTFIRICEAVDIQNWREIADARPQMMTIVDWAEAPEVSFFCDRTLELAQLERLILDDHCKVVSILGLGGIGKTSLAVKLVEQIQTRFEYVIWRSLRSTFQLKDLLLELIHFLSSPQQRPSNRLRRLIAPRTSDIQPQILAHLEELEPMALLSLLMSQLRDHRCLVILDEMDTLLEPESPPLADPQVGRWLPGAMGYSPFIKRICQERHQSCLLLLSREPFQELLLPEQTIGSLYLQGLSVEAGHTILHQDLTQIAPTQIAPDCPWQDLITYYDGNPLMLKRIAQVVHQFMANDFGNYVAQLALMPLKLTGIAALLEQYLTPLSHWEREVMDWLAISEQPLTLSDLQNRLLLIQSKQQIINTLDALQQRSLIARNQPKFTLSPVLKHHLRQQLRETIQTELLTANPQALKQYSLLQIETEEGKSNPRVWQSTLLVSAFGLQVGQDILTSPQRAKLTKSLQLIMRKPLLGDSDQGYLGQNLKALEIAISQAEDSSS